MTRYWAIDDGGATQLVMTNGGTPEEEGNAPGARVAELPRMPIEAERWDWATMAIVSDDLDRLTWDLCARVDAQRDTLANETYPVRSPARQLEYNRKAIEAQADGGPWPWLTALAIERGTTVEDERLAVLTAMDAEEAALRAIAAAAVTGKAQIRTAATFEAKRAAYDALAWPLI